MRDGGRESGREKEGERGRSECKSQHANDISINQSALNTEQLYVISNSNEMFIDLG